VNKFIVEFTILGALIGFAILPHLAWNVSPEIRALFGQTTIRETKFLVGIRSTERKWTRRFLFGFIILVVIEINFLLWPWIRYTGIFLRDKGFQPLYRRHVILSAYNAEAKGELRDSSQTIREFQRQISRSGRSE
jgi:hypothetical protein